MAVHKIYKTRNFFFEFEPSKLLTRDILFNEYPEVADNVNQFQLDDIIEDSEEMFPNTIIGNEAEEVTIEMSPIVETISPEIINWGSIEKMGKTRGGIPFISTDCWFAECPFLSYPAPFIKRGVYVKPERVKLLGTKEYRSVTVDYFMVAFNGFMYVESVHRNLGATGGKGGYSRTEVEKSGDLEGFHSRD